MPSTFDPRPADAADAVPAPLPDPLTCFSRETAGTGTTAATADADPDAAAGAGARADAVPDADPVPDADAVPDAVPVPAADPDPDPAADPDPDPAAVAVAAVLASPAFISIAPAVASPASSTSSNAIAIVGARVADIRIDASDGSNGPGTPAPRTGAITAVSFVVSGFCGGRSIFAPHTPQNRDPSSLALPHPAQLVVTP